MTLYKIKAYAQAKVTNKNLYIIQTSTLMQLADNELWAALNCIIVGMRISHYCLKTFQQTTAKIRKLGKCWNGILSGEFSGFDCNFASWKTISIKYRDVSASVCFRKRANYVNSPHGFYPVRVKSILDNRCCGTILILIYKFKKNIMIWNDFLNEGCMCSLMKLHLNEILWTFDMKFYVN